MQRPIRPIRPVKPKPTDTRFYLNRTIFLINSKNTRLLPSNSCDSVSHEILVVDLLKILKNKNLDTVSICLDLDRERNKERLAVMCSASDIEEQENNLKIEKSKKLIHDYNLALATFRCAYKQYKIDKAKYILWLTDQRRLKSKVK